ncbi:FKBP-type peptidyl-prolyl cis-trans isomerase fkpA precursor [Kluyvera cryocrescens]|uniref:FKBP-type peptidyl-prolyl cis-trans isomerase fkpA n=1 Tax=Kluyvera cryocrescens TaxID=580 RepID=A0A485AFD2_KLUCR|nr:FKBP-type peptidyl-prolyl cis-trans isomerase fkpA precursor [Kluyvera cryocrescens]
MTTRNLAYALGASLGRYMENSLKEQEKLGIKLDKDQLIAGVQDAFADKSKLVRSGNRTNSAGV